MEFSVSNIIKTIKEVILNTKVFWESEKELQKSQQKLLLEYYFPIVLVVAFGVFIGEFFRSSHFYVGFAALKAVREIVLFTLQYFVSVYFTNELMKTFGAPKNKPIAQKLVVYSLTPFLLVSLVTGLFPFLYVVDIFGLFSFFIFWIGAKNLLEFPENKQNSYILITIVVNFFVFSFLSILLLKLLTAYF